MKSKIALLAIIAAVVGAFFYFDLGAYLTLEGFKSRQAALSAAVDANPLRAALIFFAVYVAVAATSFPGAAILTLVGGAIFGFWTGLLLVSFASSVGATLAFLSARFLLRDFVQGIEHCRDDRACLHVAAHLEQFGTARDVGKQDGQRRACTHCAR